MLITRTNGGPSSGPPIGAYVWTIQESSCQRVVWGSLNSLILMNGRSPLRQQERNVPIRKYFAPASIYSVSNIGLAEAVPERSTRLGRNDFVALL